MSVSALVVDDDRDSRVILRTWLRQWGFKVREADSADTALEAMMARPAAIIFCDIMMPGRNGLWLAKRVHAKWPHTAIVMASGLTDMQTAVRAKRLGAVDFLVKPFGREMLLQAVERAAAHA